MATHEVHEDVHEGATGERVATLETVKQISLIALPGGRLAASSFWWDDSDVFIGGGTFRIWELGDDARAATLESQDTVCDSVRSLAMLEGGRIAAGLRGGRIKVWDWAFLR